METGVPLFKPSPWQMDDAAEFVLELTDRSSSEVMLLAFEESETTPTEGLGS